MTDPAITKSDFPSLGGGQLYRTSLGNIVDKAEANTIRKHYEASLEAERLAAEPSKRPIEKLEELKKSL